MEGYALFNDAQNIFTYNYIASKWKEGNVLFNDALNTF